MNSPVLGLRVAGTLFGLMALAQLTRLLMRPEILVAGYRIPLWPSAIAVVVLGGMSLWMWKLARTPLR
jgi:hypothetical protein